MTIRHHPDDSTLMSFAAGSLPEALAAVVASHLGLCPVCASEVRSMERIGIVLFGRLAGRAVERPAPHLALRSIEADVDGAASPSAVAATDVPVALQALIGPRLDGIAWKRLGMGVWHLPLPLSPGSDGDLRLLRVAPGQAMPEHGHGGTELTLLLAGSYRDEFGDYHAGDLSDLGEEAEHRPIADPHQGCICLIGSERRARFKGLLGRLVQPLTGI